MVTQILLDMLKAGDPFPENARPRTPSRLKSLLCISPRMYPPFSPPPSIISLRSGILHAFVYVFCVLVRVLTLIIPHIELLHRSC